MACWTNTKLKEIALWTGFLVSLFQQWYLNRTNASQRYWWLWPVNQTANASGQVEWNSMKFKMNTENAIRTRETISSTWLAFFYRVRRNIIESVFEVRFKLVFKLKICSTFRTWSPFVYDVNMFEFPPLWRWSFELTPRAILAWNAHENEWKNRFLGMIFWGV